VEFSQRRGSNRIRPFPSAVAPAAAARRGVPVELGTRAFDLLLVLLEADGALVTKEEILNRVWPGIVVSEENLEVQVSKLRKALGAERDVIRTDYGRGYRFIGTLRSSATARSCRGAQSCGFVELCFGRTADMQCLLGGGMAASMAALSPSSLDADVLADKDPSFRPENFCRVIRASAWPG
jgi:hypothetical protein